MKPKLIYLAAVLTVSLMRTAQSQPGCEVPLSPVLVSVSINPLTSMTELSWLPSPSTGLAAYIVYRYSNGSGIPLDTIWDPAATTWLVNSPGIKYFSESYVVAAFRLPVCTSPLSNIMTTIHCNASIDSCNNQIAVSWNPYPDYPRMVTGYRVEAEVSGIPGSTIYFAGREAEVLHIDNFTTDTEYCFTVSAMLEDGTMSLSNKSCTETSILRPPDWINGIYAASDVDKKISLSFEIDPDAETSRYILERKEEGSEGFSEIAVFNGRLTRVDHIDISADNELINHYRLIALNGCGNTARISNTLSTVVLTAELKGNEITLAWNPFCCWNGVSTNQEIWYDPGTGMELLLQTGGNDSTYALSYSELMYYVSGAEICFRVKASEVSNPYGINGTAESGKACTDTKEYINVPNAFTPDGDLVNDRFRPVLSFSPSKYRLLVTDLRRRKVFESEDPLEEWDGTYLGSSLPAGAYLWFLELMTPSGAEIERTGVVTIIR
jgi:gliding motility-associated-like protein